MRRCNEVVTEKIGNLLWLLLLCYKIPVIARKLRCERDLLSIQLFSPKLSICKTHSSWASPRAFLEPFGKCCIFVLARKNIKIHEGSSDICRIHRFWNILQNHQTNPMGNRAAHNWKRRSGTIQTGWTVGLTKHKQHWGKIRDGTWLTQNWPFCLQGKSCWKSAVLRLSPKKILSCRSYKVFHDKNNVVFS